MPQKIKIDDEVTLSWRNGALGRITSITEKPIFKGFLNRRGVAVDISYTIVTRVEVIELKADEFWRV